MTTPLREVTDLTKHFGRGPSLFARRHGLVRAVDGISFTIRRGETLALVGESGCGKSTAARTIARLTEPTTLDGVAIGSLRRADLRNARRDMQMVFQDPYASLDPRWTVRHTLLEKYRNYRTPAAPGEIEELLISVDLRPEHAERYPHEFSGGQRQRVGIARAIALNPKLIILDEPVSALDVSIQAQVINLLKDLQDTHALTYLFIAHDLAVVRQMANHVAVMYLGRIVETADRDTLFANPRHPYTSALLSAVPIPDPQLERDRDIIVLTGELPTATALPSGCRFRTRCWRYASLTPADQDRCRTNEPTLQTTTDTNTHVACHYPLDETTMSSATAKGPSPQLSSDPAGRAG
jgi:peptide/nickel transport system ATP-binding protein